MAPRADTTLVLDDLYEEAKRTNELLALILRALLAEAGQPTAAYQPQCNCASHLRGSRTAGWTCPVHGQQC